MAVQELAQLVRNTARFREVVSVLAKYGFADWLNDTNLEWARSLLKDSHVRELGNLSREVRVRQAITGVGTTFIKLGQVLSTRPDLVGVDLANELAELRTGTPPDPPETVKAIIHQELGASVDELYSEFDDRALASASIGQVHKAKLHDGTQVVVKVQHPGIEDRIRNDLEILEQLAEVAEKYSTQMRQYQPAATTADFRRTLFRELDFRSEQRNLERFRRNFKDDPTVCFPAPYAQLSSRRVLTMDMLEGINMSDGAALRSANFDLKTLARLGANLFVEMIFRDAFYHADPHPGNLMVLVDQQPNRQPSEESSDSPDEVSPDSISAEEVSPAEPAPDSEHVAGIIGVLDCGMVGRLDEPLREDIETALLAIVRGDSDVLVEVFMRRGATPDDLDPDDLQLDLEDFLEQYGQQSLDDFDLSGCLDGIVEVIRRHKIVLPSKIAMLLKVLIMLEGTAQQLSPNFSLAELIEPYGRKAIAERYSPKRLLKRLHAHLRDWEKLVEILPRDAADILQRVKKGSFDVNLNHRRLDTTINRLILGILAAALFMGSSSLLASQILSAWGVSIPGALGCTAAVWLGFTVIRAIKKSGDIRQR